MMNTKITKKLAVMSAMGMGLMALPFAMPSTAQADDFRISLNLGGAPYYSAPQRVVYHQPAPQRVVYVKQPKKVVYVGRPVYRERIVYRDNWRGHGKGHKHGHGRWDDRGHRVAWR